MLTVYPLCSNYSMFDFFIFMFDHSFYSKIVQTSLNLSHREELLLIKQAKKIKVLHNSFNKMSDQTWDKKSNEL